MPAPSCGLVNYCISYALHAFPLVLTFETAGLHLTCKKPHSDNP